MIIVCLKVHSISIEVRPIPLRWSFYLSKVTFIVKVTHLIMLSIPSNQTPWWQLNISLQFFISSNIMHFIILCTTHLIKILHSIKRYTYYQSHTLDTYHCRWDLNFSRLSNYLSKVLYIVKVKHIINVSTLSKIIHFVNS